LFFELSGAVCELSVCADACDTKRVLVEHEMAIATEATIPKRSKFIFGTFLILSAEQRLRNWLYVDGPLINRSY
jgi:hypothetical protein